MMVSRASKFDSKLWFKKVEFPDPRREVDIIGQDLMESTIFSILFLDNVYENRQGPGSWRLKTIAQQRLQRLCP
jgi:hypothetical protein